MLDFTRQLTIGSAVHYVTHRAIGRKHPLRLHMKSGARFELRPVTRDNIDYGVAYEIFVHRFYDNKGLLTPDSVRLVVDLGANVGYSVLYFLHEYPSCRVIAFEPHPARVAQLRRNLEIDGTQSRVELHEFAAGASNRTMRLTDERATSSLTDRVATDTLPVEVEDIFPLLQNKRIDILKMDMEGGEYEIMEDARFESLDVGAVVMEWHARGPGADDKLWCQERLRRLGFSMQEIFDEVTHGMFWATR